MSQGDYEGALRHFGEAVRIDPRNYALRINLGNVLAESGRITDAIGQYQEAVKLSPESIEGWYLSAGAYARAGRLQEALASLESALSIATRTGRTDAVRQIEEEIRLAKAKR
jgi:stress-induced-phosphoprotein 1